MSYAELHCLSNFSFQRGASHAEELIRRAAELGYTAIAITDECSLAGIVRAHEAAGKDGNAGRIKLIVGAEFGFADGLRLVLLAPTRAAYAQLSALITRGRRAADKGGYSLRREDAAQLCPDCLALWLPDSQALAADARWLRQHFREAWIAVELHRGGADAEQLARLRTLGGAHDLPCVAAGDVHYHLRGRRALQDVQTALRHRRPISECGQRLFPNGERHLRSCAELEELYPPELLAETLAIAARCRFSMHEIRYDYPRELVPPRHTPTSWLRVLTRNGLWRRWPQGTPYKVRRQVARELRLIRELRYEAFFLTVHDIVAHAERAGILCQGRGSAGNSAVCYALGITAVNPAQHALLFERFISKERAEPPDIDVDFEHQRREEVIQYVFRKYGRERAALAATVIRYRPRSALRDVGRALGIPPGQIDRLAKSLAWWDRPEQLPERLRALGFDPNDALLRRWMRLSRELIGFPRHLSQHVGGFVISDRPLSELVPVENAAMPDRTVIQWDKDDLEALGLLKVDVLALGMLSAIRRCLNLRNAWRAIDEHAQDSFRRIPQEDQATYAMIQRGETIGAFQIESRAQINMIVRLKPKTFYDLAIQVAIVRPGPIQGGMVHPYLRRRTGLEKVDYPPGLEGVLERTAGVPLFQEQVMEIAVIAAGFTPGEADQMRRSMAAWKRSGGLEQFEHRLKAGMAARGHAAAFADRIYRQILGFGSYGFPESHAISFALLAYVSSYLKCHEPAAFFAALLNSQPMGFYPPSMLVGEARRMGVELRPVDVSASEWDCTLEPSAGNPGEPAIRLGLRLVSGLRQEAAARIVAARKSAAFADIDDLAARAVLDARTRRALADADALQSLAGDRHAARWAAAGYQPLPGLLRGAAARETIPPLPAPREGADILDDYRSLRLTLRQHPLALLRPRLTRLGVSPSAELRKLPDRTGVKVAGLVMFRQRPQTPTGLMFMTLEDETGIVNLIVPARHLDAQRDALIGSRLLLVEGELQNVAGDTVPRSVGAGAGECGHPSAHDDNSSHAAAGQVVHVFLRAAQDRSDWIGDLPYLSRDFH